jgi:uncharacterized protein
VDVAVTGSSGFIGSALCPALAAAGHRVLRVVRSGAGGPDTLRWDPEVGTIDAGGLDGVGGVVHLAGESIGKRWSEKQKARIKQSRVAGTSLLSETLAKLANPPAVLVSGSAVGIYGDRGDEVLTEDTPLGEGILASVAQAWEASTAAAEGAGIRVVHLRTAEVLARHGGALQKMLTPFRLGLGGRIGSGRQWVPWITLHDHVAVILHLLADQSLSGPVNATAPQPVTNAAFTKALAGALHRPAVLPVPAPALRLLLGKEMAHELLMVSLRVMPHRLAASGFQFRDPDLDGALRRVLATA